METLLKCHVGCTDSSHKVSDEIAKAEAMIRAGAGVIADVSTVHQQEMTEALSQFQHDVILAAVPIYRVGSENMQTLFDSYYKYGIKACTWHLCSANIFKNSKCRINSRGGYYLNEWLKSHNENPFLENFNHVRNYANTLNKFSYIGNVVRSGSVQEFINYKSDFKKDLIHNLSQAARFRNPVLEIGGHIPLDHIGKYCSWWPHKSDAKFCVMGPLVNDVFAGQDHIVASIGLQKMVSLQCKVHTVVCITEAEHVSIPSLEQDVRAVKFWRTVLGTIGLQEIDNSVEWKNEGRCHRRYNALGEDLGQGKCSMCGDFCPLEKIRNESQET